MSAVSRMNHPECISCSSRCASVYSDIQPTKIDILISSKSCRTYEKGETIFYPDETPTGIYCIHSGLIKVFTTNFDGKDQIIRIKNAGDILGYRALLSGSKYGKCAVAMEQSIMCLIPREAFFKLLSEDMEFSLRVMNLLSQQLKIAQSRMATLAQTSVRERLAECLLLIEQKFGKNTDGTLTLKLTREEFSQIVCTSTETVIRLLGEFRDEGAVEFHGRKIAISNPKLLLEIANIHD